MDRSGPVVIVGGGASGTLVAIHVAARAAAARSRAPREVVVVEPGERLGEGIAYGTTSRSHLLNVRAGGMSAFPDRPDHFTDWARGTGLALDGSEFLPRMLYARYLRDALAEAAADGIAVRHVRARATDVRADDGGLRVATSEGGDLLAGDVVLATGNGLAPLSWLPELPGVIRDPWTPGALERVDRDARVVIVGSGLTAVDVVLSLRDQDHRGRVVMVSSHGLLPRPHAAAVLAPRPAAVDPAIEPGVRALIRALREDAAAADDWRQTVDGVRSVTVATWRALPRDEQRRALRHASRLWEVCRHRMAPQVAMVVDGLRGIGWLSLERGRVRGVGAADGALAVTVRSAGSERRVDVDVVIACVGPSADPLDDRLLSGAVARGLLARHPLGLGLAVDVAGRAQRPDGAYHEHLWATGSLRKGAEWESTAVPELRLHARDIAAALPSEG